MTIYALLPTALRGAVPVLWLALLIFALNLSIRYFAETWDWTGRLLCPAVFLVCFTAFCSLGFCAPGLSDEDRSTPLLPALQTLPWAAHLAALAFCFCAAALLALRLRQLLRGTITRTSVKQSADNLPAGLCYAEEDGLPILTNHAMDRLSRALTGREVQSAETFWAAAAARGRALPGGSLVLGTPDGRTWTLARRTLSLENRAVTELLAFDTTDLDRLRSEAESRHAALLELNGRLRRYSLGLAEVAARRERLATKQRLHDELGHTLLATRYALAQETPGDTAALLEVWRRDVAVLRGEAGDAEWSVPRHLERAASELGAALSIEGAFPPDGPRASLLAAAANEALNNAVRHAGATALTLRLTQTDAGLEASFTNNGRAPDGPCAEGGGLSALRAKTEEAGGTMALCWRPAFRLTLTLPGREKDGI